MPIQTKTYAYESFFFASALIRAWTKYPVGLIASFITCWHWLKSGVCITRRKFLSNILVVNWLTSFCFTLMIMIIESDLVLRLCSTCRNHASAFKMSQNARSFISLDITHHFGQWHFSRHRLLPNHVNINDAEEETSIGLLQASMIVDKPHRMKTGIGIVIRLLKMIW